MKIWYLICVWLFLDSVNILIKESNEILYKLIDQEEPYDYLACFDLKEINILSNKTTVDLHLFNESLYNHFNKLEYRYIGGKHKLKWSPKSKDLEKYNKLILNPIKSKNYIVLRGQFCFSIRTYNLGDLYFVASLSKKKKFLHF